MQAPHQSTQHEVRGAPSHDGRELLEKAQLLAQGLEFAQVVLRARTLDEVYLLLTNDIRCIVEFDRGFLVTHLGGDSRFVAAGGSLAPEKKSRFYRQVSRLALNLNGLNRSLFVSRNHMGKLAEYGIGKETAQALKAFVDFSGASYMLCVPLTCNGNPIGHLVFEFLDETLPDTNSVLLLGKMEPFLGIALAQKWLEKTKPAFATMMSPSSRSHRGPVQRMIHKARFVGPVAILVLAVLFAVPFQHTVGGEAEVVPEQRHMAFSGIEGLIDKVHVQEGAEVQVGTVLAVLDPRDLDFRINVAQRELEILTREMGVLRDAAGNHPAKLAQAEIVELNRKKKQKELDYLKSRRHFLEIKAPVAGTITTKNVQSLSGKRFAAGDPFCEIAVRKELCVDVNVPDDRITLVKPGQEVWVYLNGDPTRGHRLTVKEIAPRAEALPRFGNIFRARADFSEAPPTTMVGMKGIGKIHTGSATLWSIVSHKLITRWNELTASVWL